MSLKPAATLELQQLDEYLGFEIVLSANQILTAVPKFRNDRSTILCAVSMPQIRKRIWQWWHLPEGWTN